MNNKTVFDVLTDTINQVNCYAVLGGECDELVRFLQLEWESYSDAPKGEDFYRGLEEYEGHRTKKDRNWRESFSNRDFNSLIV